MFILQVSSLPRMHVAFLIALRLQTTKEGVSWTNILLVNI